MKTRWLVLIGAGIAATTLTATQTARSADSLVAAALTRARAEDKMVFVEFGASWCVPCRRLVTFLEAPEIKPLLDAHYVMVRITVWESRDKAVLNNTGGEAMMAMWGAPRSIPFFAILDASGTLAAKGGDYPGNSARIQEFLGLLERTAPRMPASARNEFRRYLETHSDPFGSVAGRVLDERGLPISNATVTLLARRHVDGQWQPVRSRRVQAGEDGRYSFDRVEPGEYRILAEGAGTTGVHPQPAGRSTIAGLFSIERNVDITTADVSAVRIRTARLSGTVHQADGTPANRAIVTAIRSDLPGEPLTGVVQQDGSFVVTNVPYGSYAIWARVPAPVDRPDAPRELGFANARVTAPDANGVRIHTSSGTTLAGSVRLEGPALAAADLAAVRVDAVAVGAGAGAPRERLQSAILAGQRIEIRGVWGRRVIRAESLPAGWILDRVMLGNRDVTDTPIDFSAVTAPVDLFVTLTKRAGQIAGIAVDEAGQPRRGGVVIAFAADATRWQYPSRVLKYAPVDDKGVYLVRSLVPGTYLVAWQAALDANWSSPEALERLKSTARLVEVQASGRD